MATRPPTVFWFWISFIAGVGGLSTPIGLPQSETVAGHLDRDARRQGPYATVFPDRCEIFIPLDDIDRTLEWNVSELFACEYSWQALVNADDGSYRIGFAYFRFRDEKQRGTIDELLAAGQAIVWNRSNARGPGSLVRSFKPRRTDNSIQFIVEGSDIVPRLFSRNPKTITLETRGTRLANATQEIPVEYLQSTEDRESPTNESDPYARYNIDGEKVGIDVDRVLRDLRQDDWQVQFRATEAISFNDALAFRNAIPILVKALSSEQNALRLAAARIVGHIAWNASDDGQRIPELESAFAPLMELHRSAAGEKIQYQYLWPVFRIGRNLGGNYARQVVPLLIDALKDAADDDKSGRIENLGDLGSDAELAVPEIIAQLTLDRFTAAAAIEALGKIKRNPDLCVPALQAAMQTHGDDGYMSGIIASSFGRFGPDAKDAVPTLILLLKHREEWTKWRAAVALGRIGSGAASAVPALEQLIRDAPKSSYPGSEVDVDVQLAALAALCAIGDEGRSRALATANDLTDFQIVGVGENLDNPGEVFGVLSQSKGLKQLNLSYSSLTDDQLAPLAEMTQLEALDLPQGISAKGLGYVAGLSNLRSLSISHSDIGDEELVNLDQLVHLERLSLYSTNVTDKGMSRLIHLRELKELWLNWTTVGDDGLAVLVKDHPGLERLSLCHTKITAACVPDLLKLTKLKFLCVYETPLNGPYPEQSLATGKIRKTLPDCEVLWID